MTDEQNGNKNDGTGADVPRQFFKLIPLWFIAIAALIYSTGFLAVSTFHESYNLRGMDSGFFKIKYAHVGMMFVAIPLIIGIATFALFHYLKRKKEATKTGAQLDPFYGPPHPLVILLTMLVALTLYMFAFFAPPGTFRDVHWYLGFMIVIAVVGHLVAKQFAAKKRALLAIHIIVVILQAILLLRVTWNFKENLMEMFIPSVSLL